MQARKHIATALILIAIVAGVYAGSIGLGFKPAAQPTPAAMPTGQYSLSLQGSGIIVEPGTTVQVGEEVFLDGSDVTIPEAALLPNGMIEGSYVWDFGDDYYIDGGTTVSHYYMRPGTYTVTLNVTDVNGKNKKETTTIIVEGKHPKLPPKPSIDPILELKFEDNLNDTSGNGLNGSWVDGTGSFVDGIEGKAVDVNGVQIKVSDAPLLGGMNEFTISMWIKKKTSDSTGYLIYKESAYYTRVRFKDRTSAYVKTDEGSGVYSASADEIENTMWHHYVVTYNGSVVRLYVDGKEKEEGPWNLSGSINDSESNIIIGQDFNAVIDEIKIWDVALSEDEITRKFELLHAPFHGHIAQYIYAQIPGEFTKDSTNKIKATIIGDGYSNVIYTKNNLQPEEKFLLNNSELPAGNYVLTVKILDAGDNLMDELTEKFSKPYDGVPKVGIDENNAIRVNGELFFPVTPWILSWPEIPIWKTAGYVNALHNPSSHYSLEGFDRWEYYLGLAHDNNFSIMGGGDDWCGGKGTGDFVRNSDPNALKDIIEQTKTLEDYPALSMWMWDDEPDLGGEDHYVPSPVVASWAYKTHQLDPQHLVKMNYCGAGWAPGVSGWHINRRGKYEYLYNEDQFGGKKAHVSDITGFDYYPIDEWYKGATVSKFASALDNLREENYNLVPCMVFMEGSNRKIDIAQYYTSRAYPQPHDVYTVSDASNSIITSSGNDHFAPYVWEDKSIGAVEIMIAGDEGHAVPRIYHIAEKIDDDTIKLTTNATDGLGDDTNVTLYLLGTPPPTAEQLRMLAWLSVVHGIKGISWNTCLTTTLPEDYAVMAEFTDHITRLTPIVLGPETDKAVTNNAADQGGKVDTMIREDGDNIWLIAVRLTEPNESQSDDDIVVTFEVDGLTSNMNVIEPKEFVSQSIKEEHGDAALGTRREFSFSLENTPITPGTVQVSGSYGLAGSEVQYLYDDGQGNLKWGDPDNWRYDVVQGTVDYSSGDVYVDFGTDGSSNDILILPGKYMVQATYRPVQSDRIISHTGNIFTDLFAPNDVHIYTIPVEAQSQECVDTPALLGHISQWKQGQTTMLALMQKIAQWKTGC